jgi:hypothetical protein
MEAKFTSGPWRVGQKYAGGTPVYFADNRHFCTVYNGLPGDGMDAIARLIAAAPDLLEALRDMVSDRECLSQATVDFALAAIAKATGAA